MMKRLEASDPKSCWNKAAPSEIVFVLLERDAAAPATIERWCEERIRLGKNHADDPQIAEAMACAAEMRRLADRRGNRMSPADTYRQLSQELEALWEAGLGESPEADRIRDLSDEPWYAMSEAERNEFQPLRKGLTPPT